MVGNASRYVATGCLVLFCIGVFLMTYLHLSTTSHFSSVLKNAQRYDSIRDRRFISSNWIVITTIAPPTVDIIALSKIPGWQLLVVGDTKTPKDWSCEGAIFLSVEDQELLTYNILERTPHNSYCRKNVGYLYAIQHGAKTIYETDDDNHPFDALKGFIYKDNITILEAPRNSSVFNPYGHFGQETIWPRGYPLQYISKPNNYKYRRCATKRPSVQQGLVNGDPDVDAIFRLSRKNIATRINVNFDSSSPPVSLGPKTFCPYNSQNTLFHYNALWSLVLPASVNMRVTDIWRGYWAQGLLPLIGERLVFLKPNAVQFRNAHSYLKDFQGESLLYLKAGAFVSILEKWQCKKSTLEACSNELSSIVASAGLWAETDVKMLVMWFKDLRRVGYTVPSLQKDNACDKSQQFYIHKPRAMPTVFQNSKSLQVLQKK